MKYIVILTGGIGSGKTTVSNIFNKLGADVIDADIISKKILVPGSKILRKIFKKCGKIIINNDYSLNRKALRDLIFNSYYLRKWINKILHPMIYHKIYKEIKKSKSLWCLIVIPLLIESNIKIPANRILVVYTTLKNQIKRVVLRDHENEHNVKKIISIQSLNIERLNIAHDVIFNNKSLNYLAYKVKKLYNYYCFMANNNNIFLNKYNTPN